MFKGYQWLSGIALCGALAACTPHSQQVVNHTAAKINHGAVQFGKAVGNTTVAITDEAGRQVVGATHAVEKRLAVVTNWIGELASDVNEQVSKIANYSTALLPEDLPLYRQAIRHYIQYGGTDPLSDIRFSAYPTPPNLAHNLQAKTQYIIDAIMPYQQVELGKIVEFHIEDGVAYLQLIMDSQHGTEMAELKAMVRPVVMRNLLVYPQIHHVIWRQWVPSVKTKKSH